jgi:hypothetical protein
LELLAIMGIGLLRRITVRRTPALEHSRLAADRLFPSRLDTLIRCPLKNKWTLRD